MNTKVIEISSLKDVYKIRHLKNKFDEIVVNCQTLKYTGALRYALKYSLFACNIEGTIRIHDEPSSTFGFSRSKIDAWQVLHECAKVFYNDCSELLIDKSKSEFVFKKIRDNYKNSGITFGILFSGNDDELSDLITSVSSCIDQEKAPNKEILICGPSGYDKSKFPDFINQKTKYLDYVQEDITSRFLVNHKKKYIYEHATYNIVCINHARISYSNSFYKDIIDYPIEFCSPRVVAYQNNIEFNYLGLSFLGSYDVARKDTVLSFQGDLIDLDYLYYLKKRLPFIGGGLYVLNKNVVPTSIFDTRIAWGEAEDINLSMRIYHEGFLIDFFPQIKCFSSTTKYIYDNSIMRRLARRVAKYLVIHGYL